MSSVDKLQIRGIRSFSPNRDETIEFYAPLTMIVGANGCGKTTIIECLKMACTGTLPPTCSQGQSFINDPGMTNTTEVKAHIKMRFNNQAGYPTVVARSFQVTKKKSQIQFKSLDGTIRLTDAEGRRESISQKCADLDKQMPELLGIAAPILDNVVFCHQEESAWPLQEGATLKKKFDDIFDSTRYTKALEAITKTKKELNGRSKDLKADVAELGAHLHTSVVIKKELKSFETKVKECQDEVEILQEKEQAIQEKINQLNQEIKAAEQAEQSLLELRRMVGEADRRAMEKEESLERVFTEDDHQLQAILNDFQTENNSRASDLQKLRQTEKSFQSSVKDKREALGILQNRRGEAFALQQDLEIKRQEEHSLMQQIAESYNLTLPSISTSSSSSSSSSSLSRGVELFLKQFDTKIENLTKENEKKLTKAMKDLEIAQKKTRQAQLDLQQITMEIGNDDRELSRIERERHLLRTELNTFDSLSQRNARPQAEAEVKQATEEWESFNATLNVKRNQINEDRRKYEDEIRHLNESITSDNRLLQDLSLYRSENERLEAQLRHTEQDLRNCEADANTAAMKYRHVMDHYLTEAQADTGGAAAAAGRGGRGGGGHGTNLISSEMIKLLNVKDLEAVVKYLGSEAIQKQKIQMKSLQENSEKIRKEISTIQANVDHDRRRRLILQKELEQFRLAEKELEECVSELNAIRYTETHEEMYPAINYEAGTTTSGDTFDLLLDTCAAAERAAAETCMALDSSKLWRDRILKKSRQKIPTDGGGTSRGGTTSGGGSTSITRRCPCCDKNLLTSNEILIFENNLNDLFKSNLATDDLIKQANDFYSSIQKITTRITTAVSIARGYQTQQQELHEILSRLSQDDEILINLQNKEIFINNSLQKLRNNEIDLEKCILELSTLHNQWFGLIQKYEEIKIKKQRQLEIIAPGGGTGGGGGGRSIQEIEDEVRRCMEDKNNLQIKKSRLDEDFNRLERHSLALKSTLSDKERNLLEVSHRQSRLIELNEKLQNLEVTERGIISSKGSKIRERSLQEREVAKMEAEEFAEKTNFQQNEKLISEQFSNFQNLRNRFLMLTKAHVMVAKRCEEMKLETIDHELEFIKIEIHSIEKSLSDLHPKISSLENQMNQQEHTKRMIAENISARAARQEAIELFTKLHEMESKLDSGRGGGGSGGGGGGRSMSLQELQRQLQRFLQNKQTLEKEKHGLIGRMETLIEQIDLQQKKLVTPVYKNIDDRYRKKNIEYETTLVAVGDLESYYQALDTALQRFHTLRVDEINKSIKELWQLAYRGGDIDSIEIVSGDESATGRALKSYNYRVVMRKGDVPLDMRGRCSAGQRVLASIVIRLALAEAFCVSCGIMALDEPTTNLDESHKTGLAHALSRIISNRSQQQNFQLIVITHDEEFVKLMNEELSSMPGFAPPESYFRIGRREDGTSGKFFSHIEKIPWDDM